MTALYILGALLLVLLAVVLLAPLVEEEEGDVALEDLPLRERREAALEALREIEFEYATEKLPEDDYRRLRARYGRVALEAREALEERGSLPAGAGEARAGASGREAGARPGDDAAAGDGTDAEGGAGAGRKPCVSCETSMRADARFCPRCGARQEGA